MAANQKLQNLGNLSDKAISDDELEQVSGGITTTITCLKCGQPFKGVPNKDIYCPNCK